MTDISSSGLAEGLPRVSVPSRSNIRALPALAVVVGLFWSVLFITVGLQFDLQMFGDGSIFSYSVAVEDGWLFHWRNIAARLSVYLLSHVPAEMYVKVTGDAHGGIVLYGLLFFAAPLVGLVLTFYADRSNGRIIFGFACFSTAVLCPLVFGAPTEMWMAHALFWPALAVCHYARGPFARSAIFFIMLALVFTHEGALIFAIAILGTLLLRGMGDPLFRRAVGALLPVLAVWVFVKLALPPDRYIAGVLATAAFSFIDVLNLTAAPFPILVGAIAGYWVAFLILQKFAPARAHIYAGLIVLAALATYWLVAAGPTNGDNRYHLRTALLVFTPLFGALATAYALEDEGRLECQVPLLPFVLTARASGTAIRAACGAIVMATLVHGIETARFVTAWRNYEDAMRALAAGASSDPELGDARFVSSERIPIHLDAVEWPSTAHFLSVLVAPGFAPTRLVVDPNANYFWLSCKAASASRDAVRAIPVRSRELVRIHACLHR